MSKPLKTKTSHTKNFDFQRLKDRLQYGYEEDCSDIYYGEEWKNVSTISELIKFATKRVPLGSPDMCVINSLIADYLKPVYNKEYVLVRSVCSDASPYERKMYKEKKLFMSDMNEGMYFYFAPRYRVEWNAGALQFSLSCILKLEDNVILLKSKKGFLNGKITMIQGHCSYELTSDYVGIYSNNLNNETKKDFEAYFENQLLRELFEEVSGITKDDIQEIKYITHIYPNYTDPSNVSYYHEGPCYMVTLKNDKSILDKIKSGEPHKHDVVIFNDAEFKAFVENDKERLDDWLREAVEAL